MLRLCLGVCLVSAFVTACLGISQQEIDQFYNCDIVDHTSNFTVRTVNVPDHPVGDFPNPDNPNVIEPQNFVWGLYKNPTPDEISCLPLGPIGVSKGGIALFNPYNIDGIDAVEVEVFDECHGHPDAMGVYHYHQDPKCLHAGEPDVLIGAAFDGYPIYGYRDADGSIITPSDLDVCGGRYVDGEYRYHLTLEFPYIMGCFSGRVPKFIRDKQQGPNCKFAFPESHQRAVHPMDSGSSSGPVSSLLAVCLASLAARSVL